MKFYQTTALVMLSIMCTAPVLGAKETTKLPYLGKEIYSLIRDFCGKDLVYKEVGHLEPYQGFIKKIGTFKISTSIAALCTAALVPSLFKTNPKEPVRLASLVLAYLASKMGLYAYGRSQVHSHLVTKFPDRVEIWNDLETIAIKDEITNQVEYRSLSDMRLFGHGAPVSLGTFSGQYTSSVERGELCYVLNRGEVDILCGNDIDDYDESRKKLRILQTPSEYLTSLDVSEDQSVIVVTDRRGFLRKYKLQKSEDMNTIIGEMDTD